MRSFLDKMSGNAILKRVGILTLSQAAGIGAGLLGSIINARVLGTEYFGVLSFTLALVAFSSIFFRFGFFSSTEVLLAENNDFQTSREIIGAALIIGLIIGLLFGLSIFYISSEVDIWFNVDISVTLRRLTPILVPFPLVMLALSCAKGLGEIRYAAILQGATPVLVSIGICLLFLFNALTISRVLFLTYSSSFVVVSFIFWKLRPSLRNVWSNLCLLLRKNCKHGFPLFIGQLSDQIASQIPPIIIPIFWGPAEVGFFALANRITSLVSLLSQNLGFAYFRRFASAVSIDRRIMVVNTGIISIIAIVFVLCIGLIISFLYGPTYAPVINVCYALLCGQVVRAAYQPINSFLNSKSRGRTIRIASIAMLISSLPCYTFFVPLFGATGAGMAVSIGYAAFGIVVTTAYQRLRKQMVC